MTTPSIQNRKARQEFRVLETREAGIVLTGTEIKSLREGRIQMGDAWVDFTGGEAWLQGVHIPEYRMGNRFNHQPQRRRKLLLHRLEIEKLSREVDRKGRTVVPLRIYFNDRRRAKVEIGLCEGKDRADRRQTLIERDDRREIGRVMKKALRAR